MKIQPNKHDDPGITISCICGKNYDHARAAVCVCPHCRHRWVMQPVVAAPQAPSGATRSNLLPGGLPGVLLKGF